MIINGFTPSEEVFSQSITSENTKKTSGNKGLFADTLKNSLDKINDMQITADEATRAFVSGEDIEIHEVMLAGEEAKVSLQFAVEMRNKLVEAYQELSRMQL